MEAQRQVLGLKSASMVLIMATAILGAGCKADRGVVDDIECLGNMETIYLVKKMAVERGFPRGRVLPETDIKAILKDLNRPPIVCPKGGHYTINSFDNDSVCSVHGSMSDLRQRLIAAGYTDNNEDIRDLHPLEMPGEDPSQYIPRP